MGVYCFVFPCMPLSFTGIVSMNACMHAHTHGYYLVFITSNNIIGKIKI